MNQAGRFAPSPTSNLHVGNLRTALLAWLSARQAGLAFLIRDEDLDTQRVAAAPDVAEQQIRDLSALGLDWDGPIVHQSNRFELYREAVKQLDTYECFCTRREIANASSAPHETSYRPYPGTCLLRNTTELIRLRRERPAAIRVRAEGARFAINDLYAGRVESVVDDFVLFRNDRAPAYNLAVVVDDGLQGVSQVCRGRDLLESSPRQAWLATKLGFDVPNYIHVGLAVAETGKRLAKRYGTLSTTELAQVGFTIHQLRDLIAASCGLPVGLTPPELLKSTNLASVLVNTHLALDWTIPAELNRLSKQ